MITWALIGSAVIALVLVVLMQGKWTRADSWFAAVFASGVMARSRLRYTDHQSAMYWECRRYLTNTKLRLLV
jgi:hypothetical protein